jgi:hypothetical protein
MRTALQPLLSRVLAALLVLAIGSAAEAASCRHRPPLRAGLKERVEALRTVEREAADRLKGLDTRTFDYLAAQAHAAAAAIAEPKALRVEAALARCRRPAVPVGRSCAEAGRALAALMDAQAVRTATAAKQAYLQSMPKCESFLGLKPLATTLRATE